MRHAMPGTPARTEPNFLGCPGAPFRPGEFFEARPHCAVVVLSAARHRAFPGAHGRSFCRFLNFVLCSRVFPDFSII
jgi:hypothetical protein